MLAFGRHWELNTCALCLNAHTHTTDRLPEWNEQYVRFAEFEKLASSGPPPDKFFAELTKELNRVETFRRTKEAEFSKTQQSIESVKAPTTKGKTRASMAVRDFFCALNAALTVLQKAIRQQVTHDISKMVVLYDSWNKLKSYSVLNRQGFEELVRTYNLNAKVDPAMSQAFEKRLDASAIASLKAIDEAQNSLEVSVALIAHRTGSPLCAEEGSEGREQRCAPPHEAPAGHRGVHSPVRCVPREEPHRAAREA